jgi:hypothetical protein
VGHDEKHHRARNRERQQEAEKRAPGQAIGGGFPANGCVAHKVIRQLYPFSRARINLSTASCKSILALFLAVIYGLTFVNKR